MMRVYRMCTRTKTVWVIGVNGVGIQNFVSPDHPSVKEFADEDARQTVGLLNQNHDINHCGFTTRPHYKHWAE